MSSLLMSKRRAMQKENKKKRMRRRTRRKIRKKDEEGKRRRKKRRRKRRRKKGRGPTATRLEEARTRNGSWPKKSSVVAQRKRHKNRRFKIPKALQMEPHQKLKMGPPLSQQTWSTSTFPQRAALLEED